jgi:hypothetical protein
MKSILIAEGDERVAALFSYIFAREGWTVATYRDGRVPPPRQSQQRGPRDQR